MKITMTEYDGCFAFDMVAETVTDATLLARFSMNITNVIVSASSIADRDGTFRGYLVAKKRRNPRISIARAK